MFKTFVSLLSGHASYMCLRVNQRHQKPETFTFITTQSVAILKSVCQFCCRNYMSIFVIFQFGQKNVQYFTSTHSITI